MPICPGMACCHMSSRARKEHNYARARNTSAHVQGTQPRALRTQLRAPGTQPRARKEHNHAHYAPFRTSQDAFARRTANFHAHTAHSSWRAGNFPGRIRAPHSQLSRPHSKLPVAHGQLLRTHLRAAQATFTPAQPTSQAELSWPTFRSQLPRTLRPGKLAVSPEKLSVRA